MRGLLVVGSIVAAAWLSGCGENCQSTCTHVYAESECNHGKAGVTPKSEVDACVDRCEEALQHPGALGEYDPVTTPASADNVSLTNDAEAAAWIDCVWDQTGGDVDKCVNIDPREGGICGPI